MKYRDWLFEWLDCFVRPVCKDKTYISYAGIVSKYLVPKLGAYDMRELEVVTLQRFIADLMKCGNSRTGRGLSSSTVNLIITVIQTSLKNAYATGRAAAYVADCIKRPRNTEKKTECFTTWEQTKIEREIARRNKTNLYGIIICLYTGLRIGELLALMWEDIDFACRLLYVNRTGRDGRDDNGNYTLVCNSPKTITSKRCVPLSRQMIKLLRILKSKSSGQYIISNKGKPVLIRSFQRSFEKLLDHLDIPHRGFHALRHTFATRAIESGMDVRTLSEILGHKSPTVTLGRYVHSFSEQKARMMNKLGERLSAISECRF